MKDNGFDILPFLWFCSPENGSCLQRISWIFEGYEDLLQKFQKFLPSDVGFDVTKNQPIIAHPQQQPVVFQNSLVYGKEEGFIFRDNMSMQNDANQYISSINERFSKEGDDTYSRFMQVLKEYQEGRKDIKRVVQEVFACSRFHA